MVQNMHTLLGTIEFPDEPEGDAAPSYPVQAVDSSSPLLPTEAAALDRIEKQVGAMRKSVRVELNTLMSLYYRMDLEPLFALDIGNVIRSFQAVSAETLRGALNIFMETGEREKREDLELLLKVGAEVDSVVESPAGGNDGEGEQQMVKESALMGAVTFGSLEAVQMLVGVGAGLEMRDERGQTALNLACLADEPQIAEFLVCSGAELEATTATGATPLFSAAQQGLTDLVRFLLGRGADANAQGPEGKTPIFNAIGNGHRDVVEVLLDHWARVDERKKYQETPLFLTAMCFSEILRDHRDIAELLISRGADIHARDDEGMTVLHLAAWNGALGVLDVLLENGANLHATSNDGYTALHFVARTDESEEVESSMFQKKKTIAELLVSKGIDVGALDQNGQTALKIAENEQPEGSLVLPFLRDPSRDLTSLILQARVQDT
uniref:Uncharacterized protein n=2 Tax=Chromera velia CCMP2878 TaxID=1169474 RepID=A0A0K6S9U3_9ALVE|eukprot:Cvel_8740.t1-p1 / transcript=Cvel_8740.t1 / gene=Cvel_8740 / organism=Chromera_velia_CCMP2878 / gene_product=Ankyrin repeat domain-containing protein 50, putative / transcript_product=Ankyrin repeat domain-containing protein 50, putative / location=Cvel_scaffold489:8800-10110(-) / protein_length=437 / sequence_SO=supercontig / SO=protein_coding / is_pseudo=false